jgi:hypothetical protein
VNLRKQTYQEHTARLQQNLIYAQIVARDSTDRAHSLYNQPRAVHKIVNTFQRAQETDRNRQVRVFKTGDWLMVYQAQVELSTDKGDEIKVRKLTKHWRGPYQIVYRSNELTYMVRVNNKTVPININRLKPHISREVSDIEPY